AHREAGRLLGLPARTISARLTRARALRRARLTRRGVCVPAGVLVALLGEWSASAAAPASVVKAAVASAVSVPPGAVRPRVAELAEGGLRGAAPGKRTATAALAAGLLVAAVGLGAAALA